jgi:hypothetical protein
MTLERQVDVLGAALPRSSSCCGCSAEILLPFVAGAALAFLLNPLTNRLERSAQTGIVARADHRDRHRPGLRAC